MGESGNWHGPLREATDMPRPRSSRGRRRAAWAVALALLGGITTACWVGVERVRESSARLH